MKRIFRICRILLKGRLALTKVISKRITYELILNITNRSDLYFPLLNSARRNYVNELKKFRFKEEMKAYHKKVK